jgi:hypothetical protein
LDGPRFVRAGLQSRHKRNVRGAALQAAEKVTLSDLLQNGEAITGPTSDDCDFFDS